MRSRRNVQINLQRRHYEYIANILNQLPAADKPRMVMYFTNALRGSNQYFDADKFSHFAMFGEYPSETERREQIKARAQRKAEREARREAKAEAAKVKAEAKEAVKYYKAVSNKAIAP